MLHSEARVATTQPRRYLGQLVKHFAHKIPATHDETTGRIEFPFGLCELTAEGEEALVMRVSSADAEALERLEGVVARHLERFAFREPPVIAWSRADSPIS